MKIQDTKEFRMPLTAARNRKLQLYGRKFRQLFGRALAPLLDPLFGFDIIKFDEEVVKPPEGVSTRQQIERKWGKEAANLINDIIKE